VSKPALQRAEVVAFAEFYLHEAAKLSAEVGYIPLPPRAYELATARLTARTAGSVFGGHGSQIGVSVEAVLGKP
jgi:phosphate transport system substrate-binding protein